MRHTITKQMASYTAIGVAQFCLDALLYAIIVKTFGLPVIGNILSRGVAAILGFALNSIATFPDSKNVPRSQRAARYASVWLIMTALSAGLLAIAGWWWAPDQYATVHIVAKIIIEVLLFVVTFTVMRLWVFTSRGRLPS